MGGQRSPGRRRALARLGVATLLATWGCSRTTVSTYPVSGVVSFDDGTPVVFGVVECRSAAQGPAARGKLDQNGRFKLGTLSDVDGAVAGRHRVIVVQRFTPQEGAAQVDPAGNPHRPHLGGAVAPEFGSYESSNLVIDVSPVKENQVKLVVKRAPGPPASVRQGR